MAYAHILNIHHHGIDFIQHFFAGTTACAVQAKHRNVLILAIVKLFASSNSAIKAMLRNKNGAQNVLPPQNVHAGAQHAIHARLVGEKA